MRVRVVLAVALVAVAVGLAIDMSGSAPRGAGSNHIQQGAFGATVPGGAVVCQLQSGPPSGAATAELLVGTYGRPVPALRLSYYDASGRLVASGRRPAGGAEGAVGIPVGHPRGEATRGCLHVGGSHQVAIAGENLAPSPLSVTVDGVRRPGVISIFYYRAGSESWWQLLPTLTSRFGLGKSSLFGDWTLPAMALLLLGVWVAGIRLLLRELK